MARPRPKQQSQDVWSNQSKDSISLSLHHVNPWEQESDSVTNIRKALILAEHMGINTMAFHREKHQLDLDWTEGMDNFYSADESSLAPTLADLPSFKLMSVQKDITMKRKFLLETSKKLAICQQEKQTSDLMNLDSMGYRINVIKQLCGDLNSVLKNKDKLIKYLQTPLVGDYLKIEACYHRYACDTFNLLVSTLNEVSHHLDNLIWISNQDMSSSLTEPLVGEVQSLTASLQTSYQTLQQMRRGMKQLKCNTSLTSTQE